ncbi:DUF4956 domain-containing protein [bacterium]|nr:DUF4956 domain-containing protein [bacterium]
MGPLDQLLKTLEDLSFVDRPLTAGRVIVTLLITFAAGLFIFYIYRKTFKGVLYTRNFNVGLVMTALVTSLIIMPISSNIILSLGMVGALSIVRFRTAIKDPIDTVFMFWAIAVGLACGAGFYMVAIVGTPMIGLFVFALSRAHFGSADPYLLVIQHNNGTEGEIQKALPAHRLQSRTVNANGVELMIEVRLQADDAALVDNLRKIKGVKHAALISYNGDYVS